MNFGVVILAAGNGKRMNSKLPKVLHLFDGIPILVRILREVKKLNPSQIILVLGKDYSLIIETLKQYSLREKQDFDVVYQFIPRGTGDAVRCTLDYLSCEKTIIACGDIPLLSSEVLKLLLKKENCILAKECENPQGYGRIIEGKIIEEKECTPSQKEVKLINTGIYAIQTRKLYEYVPLLNMSNCGEYYLTDIFNFLDANVISLSLDKFDEVEGVNTQEQLLHLEERYRKRK